MDRIDLYCQSYIYSPLHRYFVTFFKSLQHLIASAVHSIIKVIYLFVKKIPSANNFTFSPSTLKLKREVTKELIERIHGFLRKKILSKT